MPYYIAASPLVKIYLTEWHDRLQEDPELINDDKTPFEFMIDTGIRSIRVKFNEPQLETDPNIYRYLVGGMTGSDATGTNVYGIVPFDPQIDMVSTLDQMAQLEALVSDDPKEVARAHKRREKMQVETAAKIKATRTKVKLASEERIKRHIRFNHNNLLKQWQDNAERNVGKYPPSVSELIGAFAIKGEIAAREAKTAHVQKQMESVLNMRTVG